MIVSDGNGCQSPTYGGDAVIEDGKAQPNLTLAYSSKPLLSSVERRLWLENIEEGVTVLVVSRSSFWFLRAILR